ncbi:MAG: uracil-xanthine permease [Ruminococcaceae bacterium]|nr:uracil-xanthine permease [Oscillospiraceae bacterium]
MAKNLIYDISDRPPMGKRLIFAFQQFLAILSATIAVPAMIGLPTQMPAAIFGAGVGTLIYQLFTKFKSPVFLGSSFAFIPSLLIAVTYGYAGIVVGSIVAGLVYVVLALLVHFIGTSWVSRLMPPVIIGPTVTLIGLSLASNAMGNIVKADSSASFASGNYVALLCGLITFFTVIICSVQKKYTMPKLIPFVIGILAGYAVAAIFTTVGIIANVDYLKVINWSPVINNYVSDGQFVGLSAFFTVPKFALVEGIKELVSGNLSSEIIGANAGATPITLGGVIKIVVAFLPVALVVFAEHIADHKNLSSIIEKDLIEEPGLKRTLLGDGVGSIAGTLFGICPNTTYGESVGCVAITQNASVITITTTAFICIALSFFSPLTTALQTIPSCVMGGVCLALYGFIAVSGLKMLKDVDLGESRNLFVVAAILISGIGGLALQITEYVLITPTATALLLGILTNTVLTFVETHSKKK